MKLQEFKKQVNKLLIDNYAISIKDTGMGGNILVDAFADNETPEEFIEWYTSHYGLITKELYKKQNCIK